MNAFLRRYYLIDHRILFLTGFIFYLITPVMLGKMEIFLQYPGVALFQGFFSRIPEEKISAYILICLSWLAAFYLGHLFFKLCRPYKISLELFPSNYINRNIQVIAFLLCSVLVVFIYVSRASIFGGGAYNVGARGKLSTLVIIFDFFMIYQLISKAKMSRLLLWGTVINALLLLFAGGRLTALQTFIIFLIYKTSFAPKRWRISHILIFAVSGFIIGGAIGVWRVNATFSFARAIFSMMAEPLFTWFSTASFLAGNEIPVVNIPANFMTSFLNLVPNTFFNLGRYVVSMPAMGYRYANPFGADSIWTTLIINFGWTGSFVFIFMMGFMYNFLRSLSGRSHFWATYYILACALLPFEFFRTGFFILNKQLFFNFMFLPALIMGALRLERWIQEQLSIKRQPPAIESL